MTLSFAQGPILSNGTCCESAILRDQARWVTDEGSVRTSSRSHTATSPSPSSPVRSLDLWVDGPTTHRRMGQSAGRVPARCELLSVVCWAGDHNGLHGSFELWMAYDPACSWRISALVDKYSHVASVTGCPLSSGWRLELCRPVPVCQGQRGRWRCCSKHDFGDCLAAPG